MHARVRSRGCIERSAAPADTSKRRPPKPRVLRAGEPPEAQSTIANPVSNFALYVNTTALVWFFGYMLLEVHRSWYSPCDVPLHSYVSLFGAPRLSAVATRLQSPPHVINQSSAIN